MSRALPFSIRVRVRFAETDAMGIVHHASYLPYLESCRVEYLRELGHPYTVLRDLDGIEFAVIGVTLEYDAPLAFDDEVDVSCAVASASGARFTIAYELRRGDALIAHGETRHAVLDRATGRPQRVPEWLISLV